MALSLVIMEDSELSHSLYKLALQVINEREQSALKPSSTEEILQEEKNIQTQERQQVIYL